MHMCGHGYFKKTKLVNGKNSKLQNKISDCSAKAVATEAPDTRCIGGQWTAGQIPRILNIPYHVLNLYVIYVWNTSCYYYEYASNCMHVYIHNDIYLHTCVQMHAYMTTTMQRSSLGRRLYRYEYLHSGEYVNIPAPHQYEHVSPFIVIIAQSICVVSQSISVNDDIVSVCIMHLSVSSTNMCNLLFCKAWVSLCQSQSKMIP